MKPPFLGRQSNSSIALQIVGVSYFPRSVSVAAVMAFDIVSGGGEREGTETKHYSVVGHQHYDPTQVRLSHHSFQAPPALCTSSGSTAPGRPKSPAPARLQPDACIFLASGRTWPSGLVRPASASFDGFTGQRDSTQRRW